MSQIDKQTPESAFFASFNYNLANFFHDDYTEIDSEETPATFMVVYEKKLSQKEFDLFDRLQFRLFYDKEVISGDNPINVKLLASEFVADKVKKLAEYISNLFGLDDSGTCADADTDFYNNQEFEIFWTIGNGESFISIERDNVEGLTLNILFYNNLAENNTGSLLKPQMND